MKAIKIHDYLDKFCTTEEFLWITACHQYYPPECLGCSKKYDGYVEIYSVGSNSQSKIYRMHSGVYLKYDSYGDANETKSWCFLFRKPEVKL